MTKYLFITHVLTKIKACKHCVIQAFSLLINQGNYFSASNNFLATSSDDAGFCPEIKFPS